MLHSFVCKNISSSNCTRAAYFLRLSVLQHKYASTVAYSHDLHHHALAFYCLHQRLSTEVVALTVV
jgi:hypothetical protein